MKKHYKLSTVFLVYAFGVSLNAAEKSDALHQFCLDRLPTVLSDSSVCRDSVDQLRRARRVINKLFAKKLADTMSQIPVWQADQGVENEDSGTHAACQTAQGITIVPAGEQVELRPAVFYTPMIDEMIERGCQIVDYTSFEDFNAEIATSEAKFYKRADRFWLLKAFKCDNGKFYFCTNIGAYWQVYSCDQQYFYDEIHSLFYKRHVDGPAEKIRKACQKLLKVKAMANITASLEGGDNICFSQSLDPVLEYGLCRVFDENHFPGIFGAQRFSGKQYYVLEDFYHVINPNMLFQYSSFNNALVLCPGLKMGSENPSCPGTYYVLKA